MLGVSSDCQICRDILCLQKHARKLQTDIAEETPHVSHTNQFTASVHMHEKVCQKLPSPSSMSIAAWERQSCHTCGNAFARVIANLMSRLHFQEPANTLPGEEDSAFHFAFQQLNIQQPYHASHCSRSTLGFSGLVPKQFSVGSFCCQNWGTAPNAYKLFGLTYNYEVVWRA